jgi:hypothetical protein
VRLFRRTKQTTPTQVGAYLMVRVRRAHYHVPQSVAVHRRQHRRQHQRQHRQQAHATRFPTAGSRWQIATAAAVVILLATALLLRHRARVRVMQAACTSAMDHATMKARGRHAAMMGRPPLPDRACINSQATQPDGERCLAAPRNELTRRALAPCGGWPAGGSGRQRCCDRQ